MKFPSHLMLMLFASVLSIALGDGKGIDVPPPEPPVTINPPPQPTTKSTTPPPITKSTTSASTTKPPTPPPSTKPTTSSSTTKSTTPPTTTTSTTTKSTTSTSTIKPTTSATTPKPHPPQPKDPSIGTWSVNNTANNSSCLLVEAAIQIQVPYITVNNETYHAYINVPPNATSTGNCGESGKIVLDWPENNKLALGFAKNMTTNKYFLGSINITLTPTADNFPQAKDPATIKLEHVHPEFTTSIDKSYKCEKKQTINLTKEFSTDDTAIFQINSFQFEAFHNITDRHFTSAEDCSPFDTPDIVPIVVGCALAALVIIVLAAYLIGRRRRQARGYLSM